jgi:beta-N-acetylhexosaminidase
MTKAIRKALGQCFCIAFEGAELPKNVSDFILKNNIGGVVLFSKNNNYENPAQCAELINHIQAIGAQSSDKPYPLFICVDHEGGRIQRFKKPFTRFPSAMEIATLNSSKTSFEIAKIQAAELKAVGVNVNFAPVADINTNPKNPIIGDRAFGSDEESVSLHVSAFVRGYLKGGIQPVLKHFPGHGDTTEDSHLHLPLVHTTYEKLLEREFKPFVKGFKSGAEMVMSAHIILQKIEPKIPATLSKKILHNILRDELKFKGLIFSDDMQMKAITDNFGKVESMLMAFQAGCNILIYNTFEFLESCYDDFLTEVTKTKNKEILNQILLSYDKIIDFKEQNLLPYTPVYIPEIQSKIGNEEHLAFLEKVKKEISSKQQTS